MIQKEQIRETRGKSEEIQPKQSEPIGKKVTEKLGKVFRAMMRSKESDPQAQQPKVHDEDDLPQMQQSVRATTLCT